MVKIQFFLPRDREDIRLFSCGMAFYLAFMEYTREEPKTIEELQERSTRAFALLVENAQKIGVTLSNNDAMVQMLIDETFSWAYHYATRMLDGEQSTWRNLIRHIRESKRDLALDIIFSQLRENWEDVSETLARNDADLVLCVYEECTQPSVEIVRTVTLNNVRGRPYPFPLGACEEHRQEVHAISRDNGKIQTVLERIAPDIFLTPKILSARKEKLLIDRFRIAQRWDETNTEYRGMQQQFGDRGVQFALAFIDAYVDIAKKYELTPSASAFALSLPAIPFDRAIAEAIDFYERVFLTFEEPIETPYGTCYGFSFGVKSIENLQYANRLVPLTKSQLSKMSDIMLQEKTMTVGLDAFTNSGLAIWTLSFEFPKIIEPNTLVHPTFFMTQSWQRCESGECGNAKPICGACMRINEWYYSLYANILRLIQGDYAMEEDAAVAHRSKTVVSKRKQPDKEKHWKLRDVEVPYEYHIVSMDALLKRSVSVSPPVETVRGSWIERLDPEQIVYVRRRITLKKGRTLKDPRFHKYILAHGGTLEEGYTISVKDHEKRVPMKFETLTKLIERVEVKGPTYLRRE